MSLPFLTTWYSYPFDQLYDWVDDHIATEVGYLLAAIIGAVGILTFVGLGALINVWLERKIIGRMQVRRGPNRVGPGGLLQPVADAIKLIQKEVLQPRAADNKLFNLPPIIVFIPAMLTFAVFAWAPDMVYADLDVGVLYLLALSSVTSLAIFIAGWSSNNKYALLGAMRVIAMAISYEIPLVLALLAPVLLAGSMNIPEIVQWQRDHHTWIAFILPLPTLIYCFAATAELNRTPADIAEAESEIVAGFHTEYSVM
jgi:NADH-quinone oxidoreductase subunit H